jgi:hypothetical protein
VASYPSFRIHMQSLGVKRARPTGASVANCMARAGSAYHAVLRRGLEVGVQASNPTRL